MFLDQLARHLTGLDLVVGETALVYDPDAASTLLVESFPSNPDEIVVLTSTGGPAPSGLHGYGTPTFQVLGRAEYDPAVSWDLCMAVYDAIHGKGLFFLPDGMKVIGITAVQPMPAYIGQDDNDRPRHTHNYMAEIRQPTLHRV
jgi:hypothetical protein